MILFLLYLCISWFILFNDDVLFLVYLFTSWFNWFVDVCTSWFVGFIGDILCLLYCWFLDTITVLFTHVMIHLIVLFMFSESFISFEILFMYIWYHSVIFTWFYSRDSIDLSFIEYNSDNNQNMTRFWSRNQWWHTTWNNINWYMQTDNMILLFWHLFD